MSRIIGIGLALASVAALGFIFMPGHVESFHDAIIACYRERDERVRADCFSELLAEEVRKRDGVAIMHDLVALDGRQCHPPAHALGEALLQTYGSIETAYGHCTEECSSGCVHGIIGGALRSVPEIRASIEALRHPDKALLDEYGSKFCSMSAEACHGVGHVLFQLYTELDPALDACTQLAREAKYAVTCKRGVFMEHTLDLAGSRDPGVEPKDPDMHYPCYAVKGEHRAVCYHFQHLEQERIFARTGVTDPAEKNRLRFDACESLRERTLYLACIEGSAYAGSSAENCARYTDEDARAMCVYGTAKSMSAFDRYDEAAAYCRSEKEGTIQRACYDSYFLSLVNRKVKSLDDACAADDAACLRARADYRDDSYMRLTGQD